MNGRGFNRVVLKRLTAILRKVIKHEGAWRQTRRPAGANPCCPAPAFLTLADPGGGGPGARLSAENVDRAASAGFIKLARPPYVADSRF